MSTRNDLSGVWDGIFNYPRTLPSTAFAVTLRDLSERLVGETSEPSQDSHDHGTTLHALIHGQRSGGAVRFVKTYDDAERLHYTVVYNGTLNGDATEITGTWEIAGVWAGTFIMTRQVGIEVPAAVEVAETVR